MAFCSNCGAELKDGVAFCGNCGQPIGQTAQPASPAQSAAQSAAQTATQIAQSTAQAAQQAASGVRAAVSAVDLPKIWAAIKGHFVGLQMDYHSAAFKWAMILMLAIGVGDPVYWLINEFLPAGVRTAFPYATSVYALGFCVLVGVIAAVCILRAKPTETVKKSNFLRGFWIATLALTLFIFLVGASGEYIMHYSIARYVIAALTTVAGVLLLLRNKPKYPLAAAVTALAWAMNSVYNLLGNIRSDFTLYGLSQSLEELGGDGPSLADTLGLIAIDGLGILLLPVATALIACLLPRKIARFLMYIPTVLMVVVCIIMEIDGIEYFSVSDIFTYVDWIVIFLVQLLVMKACLRGTVYPYTVENAAVGKAGVIKLTVIPIVSVAVVTVAYMLVSAIVGSAQVQSFVDKWETKVSEGIRSEEEWQDLYDDSILCRPTLWSQSLAEDYDIYEKIRTNRYDMERITECYNHYQAKTVDEDVAEDYSYISVDEDWADDPMLSYYYDKYMEMQPTADKVSVSAYVSVNNGEIEVTVHNNNAMPLSKCTVECSFTILYVGSGYYSDVEYGRGTKTITVEDVPGGDSKEKTVSFDPDDYYDSYGSYVIATLSNSSTKITSIE